MELEPAVVEPTAEAAVRRGVRGEGGLGEAAARSPVALEAAAGRSRVPDSCRRHPARVRAARRRGRSCSSSTPDSCFTTARSARAGFRAVYALPVRASNKARLNPHPLLCPVGQVANAPARARSGRTGRRESPTARGTPQDYLEAVRWYPRPAPGRVTSDRTGARVSDAGGGVRWSCCDDARRLGAGMPDGARGVHLRTISRMRFPPAPTLHRSQERRRWERP